MDPLSPLFGLAVGILVGLTGIGGGSLMTPLLMLVLGTQPVIAVGTDLTYAALTKTVGAWRHWRQGTVDLGVSMWLAVGSIPGAIAGVALLDVLRRAYGADFDSLVAGLVAGALVITGVATLARALLVSAAARERDTVILEARHKLAAAAIGLVIGFVLGTTSTGSGALIAIGLIMVFRLTPRRVVGTDVFHAAILLWVAAAGHLVAGNVDFGLAASLLIGSVPGVWIGSALSARVPARTLRPGLGIVLVASGVALVNKAGGDLPVPVVAATPAVLILVSYLLVRLRGRPTRVVDRVPADPARVTTSSWRPS